MRDPVCGLLEEFREITRIISMEGRFKTNPRLLIILLISSIFLLATTSSTSVLLVALPIVLCIYIFAALTAHEPRTALKLASYPLAVSVAASMPLIIVGEHYVALSFMLRILEPSLLFIAYTLMVGWRNIIQGLECIGVPRHLTYSMLMLAYYLPRFITTLLSLVAARRARTMCEGVRLWWRILSTAVGELIIRSHYTSLTLSMAVTSRTLGHGSMYGAGCSGVYSIKPLIPCIVIIVIWIGVLIAYH